MPPVVEWLRKLGLAKYEELFIQQEIDWDTLQWLTEEVSFTCEINKKNRLLPNANYQFTFCYPFCPIHHALSGDTGEENIENYKLKLLHSWVLLFVQYVL